MAAAVVLAAGESTRFGSQKLEADLGGLPLLERTIRSVLDSGVESVVAVVRDGGALAVPALGDARVRVVVNPDSSRGMFSSVQSGIAAAADADPVLVLPGDMPFVKPQTVAAVIARYAETGGIVSPRYAGRRGHPIALPPAVCREILTSDARSSLHALLEPHEHTRVYVDVDDEGILRDVDRREDL